MFFKSLIIFTIFFSVNYCANFPPDLPQCKFSDTQCLTRVITEYLTLGVKGIKKINLVPIDPLFIESLKIVQGKDSPVNVQLNFQNNSLNGLSSFVINKVAGFDKDIINTKCEIYATATKAISLEGKYDIKGQVLILPIVGSGESKITLENVDVKLIFTFKPSTRRNSEYVQIDKIKLNFEPKNVIMNFGNLFNGDKLLGDTTNRFLNENWADIFAEIKPAFNIALEKVIENVINNVFNKIPYAKAFSN